HRQAPVGQNDVPSVPDSGAVGAAVRQPVAHAFDGAGMSSGPLAANGGYAEDAAHGTCTIGTPGRRGRRKSAGARGTCRGLLRVGFDQRDVQRLAAALNASKKAMMSRVSVRPSPLMSACPAAKAFMNAVASSTLTWPLRSKSAMSAGGPPAIDRPHWVALQGTLWP